MNDKQKKITIKQVVGIIIIGSLLVLIKSSITFIKTGHKGVITNLGAVQDKIMNEGFNTKIPFIQRVKQMDIQTQKLDVFTLAYSKDIQTVESQIVLNYSLKPELVNKLYQEVGRRYIARLIDPAIQESVKAATAKFTAQELIEERVLVREEIKLKLHDKLSEYFIIHDFSIVDFSFSDEYERAVEEKQVAQQAALKATNDLQRVKTEAEQRVAQAMAEAEAIKIQAEAIKIQAKAITQEASDETIPIICLIVILSFLLFTMLYLAYKYDS